MESSKKIKKGQIEDYVSNSTQDILNIKANDSDVLHTTGDESKDGSLYIYDINDVGTAIVGESNLVNSIGVAGTSTSGTGTSGGSITGIGINGISTAGLAGRFETQGTKIVSFINRVTGVAIERAYILASGLFKANKVLVNTTTDNGIDVIQANGTISANPATLSNQVVVKSQLDDKANIDGTILYHSTKWFTPTGTVSNTGTTVTSVGTQFTAAMIGSKLTINGETRIITNYTSTTVVTVNSAYSVNNAGVLAANWGVYSKSYEILSGFHRFIDSTGVLVIRTVAGNSVDISNGLQSGTNAGFFTDNFSVRSDYRFLFSSTTNAFATKDLGFRRNAAGLLEIYNGVTADGTLTNRRDLLVRNVLANEVLVGTLVDNGIDLIQVNGSISTTTIGTSETTNFNIKSNNINRVTVLSTGNVGIGTTSPTDNLTVYSPNTTTPTTFGVINNYSGQNTSGGDYEISTFKIGTSGFHASVSGKIPNGLWSDGVRLDFCTPATNNSNTQAVRISVMPFTGNVGIGTILPTSKLQVVGLPIYANNAAAITGGLTAGAFYHAGDGIVRVVF